MGASIAYSFPFWNNIIFGNAAFYSISNIELTRFGFHFECYINGMRRSDIFKGICIRYFIYILCNYITIHLDGIDNISIVCCDFKCLIFTIYHFYRFVRTGNRAVFPSGCCDGGVEIRIDVVDNRGSCYFKICFQMIDRNGCIPFCIRITPIIA